MTNCCSCNSSGRCVCCKCVRNGTACLNCVPRKNGTCQNSQPHPSPVDNTSSLSQVPCRQNSSTPDLSTDLLPPFPAAHEPSFLWSDQVNGEEFSAAIRDAYDEVIKWRRNIFLIYLLERSENSLYLRYRDCSKLLVNLPHLKPSLSQR